MEFGPITGIRSVSLFSPRKAEKEDSPRFEVDATPPTADDEAYTPSQDSENSKKHASKQDAVSAPVEVQPTPADSEPDAAGHNWFV